MPTLRSGLQFLSSEIRGLQSAVSILAAAALFSSLLALVRDRLFAHVFGASTTLDIYYAAFRIPDFIFVILGALVSVYVLIPELAGRNAKEQQRYIDTMVVGFFVLSIGICGIAFIAAPFLLKTLFPQFAENGTLPHLVLLTRILLIQPIFLGFSNILAAITQARHRYALYALSPVLYNLGIIGGLLVLYPLFGISGLAWGVIGGAFLHWSIQLPSIKQDGFFTSIPRFTETKAFFSTVWTSLPRALALSLNQASYLGLTAMAALLASGSISIFNFAFNLQGVPIAIIGASYSVAAFPTLAKALSNGRTNEFIEHIASAARHILFWSLPFSALALVLRAQIVRTILGSGAFDWTDTRLTAACFALFTLSLAGQCLTLLLVRGFYAAGRTAFPFIVAALTTITTLVLASLLLIALHDPGILRFAEQLMRVDQVEGSMVMALAAGYTIASIAGLFILLGYFAYLFKGFLPRIADAFWKSLTASFVAGGTAYIVLALLEPLSAQSTLLTIFLHGFIAGIVGLAAGVGMHALLGTREFSETVSSIRSRIWRTPLPEGQTIASAEDVAQ